LHHNSRRRRRETRSLPRLSRELTGQTVKGLPSVVVSVNECDPLRDEGINFYRFLMQNGVHARCRQVMGTVHGTEIFISCCPDISRDSARDIVNLAMG
jgi:acetyl esterase/lipase